MGLFPRWSLFKGSDQGCLLGRGASCKEGAPSRGVRGELLAREPKQGRSRKPPAAHLQVYLRKLSGRKRHAGEGCVELPEQSKVDVICREGKRYCRPAFGWR